MGWQVPKLVLRYPQSNDWIIIAGIIIKNARRHQQCGTLLKRNFILPSL
jgi:hypothetical protein